MTVSLRPYQEEGLQRLREGFLRVRRQLFVLPTGGGKCLAIGTKVLRYDGTIVNVEDVREGDLLMGPDSTPRRVLATCRDEGELYTVRPVKGDPWVCNDVHVLSLVNTETGNVVDIDVQAYLAQSNWFRHLHKQFSPPQGVDFPPSEPLRLDPYFAGVWFGDGSKRHDRVAVSKPDEEILALMHEMAERYGMRVRTSYSGTCPTHFISNGVGSRNPLIALIREVIPNVHEVPKCFLTASREDRLAFMAGIIDTDGYVHNGGIDLVQKHAGIFDGIAFIARSLGFKVTTAEKTVNDTIYLRMSISGDLSCIPTRIARKRIPPRMQKKVATRTGIKIEPRGRGEYAGFELDGDGRFLLGDFTVTHNTVCAAAMTAGSIAKGSTVWFIAHRTELIKQAFCKFARYGVPVDSIGVIMGSTPLADGRLSSAELPTDDHVLYSVHGRRRPRANVQVASIDTLRNRLKDLVPATSKEEAKRRGDPDVIIIDECHRSLAASYIRLFHLFPFAIFIGLTATPYRADGRGLGGIYEDMVVVAQPSQIVALGAILEPRVFTVPAKDLPNLASVKIRGGDYDAAQLTAAVDQTGLVGNIVEHWQRRAEGRSTVVFAASVEHSKHIVERFVQAGITAEHVDGTTPDDEREAIMRRVHTGETLVLVNMGIATEGWDEPRVKCCILARPTKSLGLCIQMAGRILRPWTAPDGTRVDPIILDHAGCILEHGFPTMDRELTLDDAPKRARKASAPVMVCTACFAVIPGGSRVCPICDFEFPRKEAERAGLEEKDGELVEVTKLSMNDKKDRYAELLKEAERTGRKPGWAYYRYKDLFNEEPPRGVKPAQPVRLNASEDEMLAAWEIFKEEQQAKNYKHSWVDVRFRAMFGRDVPAKFKVQAALAAPVATLHAVGEWEF